MLHPEKNLGTFSVWGLVNFPQYQQNLLIYIILHTFSYFLWTEHREAQNFPSQKNKPGFNRDKPCKLISHYSDFGKYNQGN